MSMSMSMQGGMISRQRAYCFCRSLLGASRQLLAAVRVPTRGHLEPLAAWRAATGWQVLILIPQPCHSLALAHHMASCALLASIFRQAASGASVSP